MGWAGTRGQLVDTSEIDTTKTSFLIKGPIYSYLIISIPIKYENIIYGYLVGKRLFEVNYPINNRFINTEAFTSTFNSYENVPPKFKFLTGSLSQEIQESIIIPLYGIDNHLIGIGIVPNISIENYLNKFRNNIWNYLSLIILLFTVYLACRICSLVYKKSSSFLFVVVLTLILWCLRYLLLWLNIPQNIFDVDLFKPVIYASKFGYGLTKSLGDLFLSSIFLVSNVLIAIYITRNIKEYKIKLFNIHNKIFNFIVICLVIVFLFLFLRAWAAVVRSAFFDSTINYSASSAVPLTADLVLMLLTLFLISACFSILFLYLVKMFRHICIKYIFNESAQYKFYILSIFLIIIGSLIFELIQNNKIATSWYYTFVLIIIFLLERWYSEFKKNTRHSTVVNDILIILVLSLVLVTPLLKFNADKKDYSAIEILSREIIKPEDAWLSHLLSQSLDDLAVPEIGDMLDMEDELERSTMAYRSWAKSLLSRIGNNCSVTYFTTDGTRVSDFSIGLSPVSRSRIELREVNGKEILPPAAETTNPFSKRIYVGYNPVYDSRGVRQGSVLVRIAGGKGNLLEPNSTDIFRSFTRINLGLRQHDLVLLEYSNNYLISASSPEIPLNTSISSVLKNNKNSSENIWLEEIIGDKAYNLFFFRNPIKGSETTWYAIGFQKSGLKWEIFLYLKFMLFYLFLLILILGFILLFYYSRGRKYILNFRVKLLAAFLFVSLIPLILLAYYNRDFAEESTKRSLSENVLKQASLITSEIKRFINSGNYNKIDTLTDDDCAFISEKLGIGFNIYRGSYLHATSMPELFTAELIDPWLPADAVLHILLREQRYYFHQQKIGNYEYFIGYYAFLNQYGSVIGVIAVPSLYRYTEVERELVERNVYLFGAYTIILLVSIIVGILLTNQLYQPLGRLKRATEIIASGKFDIDLKKTRSDEFGDLEQSFINMTNELQEAQAQLIKAEREAAWREMAKQVAHEIKNPLTPMKLSIQHIEKAYRDNAKNFDEIFKQVIHTILQQIDTLSNIATEFSHMAKMPDRKFVKVNVNEILNETANLFSQYENIKFDLNLNAASPLIYADREEIERMFLNIVKNAVQAMQENGNITIESSSDEKMVYISISDNGPGIPKEVLARIFEPYFSTKKEGMGLGLTLVKKTIDDLWGTIDIESELGKGTRVNIKLPCTGRD